MTRLGEESPAGVRRILALAQEKIGRNPSESSEVGAVYKFVLSGDDGGTFIIDLAGSPGIREGDGEADCVISMSASNFVRMTEGDSDPKFLFLTGKLKVKGDVALAARLSKFTHLFRA